MHLSDSSSWPLAMSSQYESKLSTSLYLPPTMKAIDGADAGMSCPVSVQNKHESKAMNVQQTSLSQERSQQL